MRFTAILFAVFSLHVCVCAQSAGQIYDSADSLRIEKDFMSLVALKTQSAEITRPDSASGLVVGAMAFLGFPYKYGGTSVETGFDCSGFVRAVFESSIGKVLPRRADEQAAATQKIEKDELKPGDLVFFNTMKRAFSHVGIYIGGDKFIHSPRAGAHVRIDNMGATYWQSKFNGARRVLAANSLDSMATDNQNR